MPGTNPVLCGSIAGRPGVFGVAMHNAAYRALGLNYTYVSIPFEGATLPSDFLTASGVSVILQNASLFQILVRDLVGPLHGRLSPNGISYSIPPFDPARLAPC